MKFILAAAILLIAASANAQSMTPPTCFPRVAGLAHKLGVGPNDPNNAPTIQIAACNGKNYDLLQLIDALLAKMDKATKK